MAGDPGGRGGAAFIAVGREMGGEVWKLYDAFAREYDRDRPRAVMEHGYLSEIVARLAKPASILDVGCGCGEPIGRFFIERGFAVTGVDAAPNMIAICRERFADAVWIEADMRRLDLGRRFAAIIAWDSFFHLSGADQRAMFPIFARHCEPGGLLLFTSGPKAGEAIGNLYGHELFHASLDPEEYRALLENSGFSVVLHRAEDPECGGHTVWLVARQ